MASKRPTSHEDEEDLLRMQEEFLKSQNSGSVKLAPKSRFAQRREKVKTDGISTSKPVEDAVNPSVKTTDDNKIFDAVQNIPTNASTIILGNIIERKVSHAPDGKIRNLPIECTAAGFPKVFVAKESSESSRESLFLRKLRERSKTENVKTDVNVSLEELPKSVIVEGPMAEEIHESNVKLLQTMSAEEILLEKEKLEKMLNPELVEFLKARRKRVLESTSTSSENKEVHKTKNVGLEKVRKIDTQEKEQKDEMDVDKSEEVDKEKMEVDSKDEKEKVEVDSKKEKEKMEVDTCEKVEDDPKELPTSLVEVFTEAKTKGWVHMDNLEPEKLKWTEELAVKEVVKPTDEPYNARFDFNGILLPFNDDSVTVDKGLHHHGEEPERPGYTLQELLQLSRSSTNQQRCTALSTLANILSKSRRGWYDRALNPAPLCALSEKNTFLLLRFSLDDSAVSIITSTLFALREYLVSEADEICLSRLFGLDDEYNEPELIPTDVNEVNNMDELKDSELVQIDVVATAMRTDMVLRIRYILSTIKPPPSAVNAALEILIRLARRSKEIALNIATMPNLLANIVTYFIPFSAIKIGSVDYKTNAYDVPNVLALRLCRTLIIYAGRPVVDRLVNLKVINALVSYVSSDITGQIGIELQTEALRLWNLLLSNNIAKDSVSGSTLVLLSRLQLLLSNHDLNTASELSCEYAGALILVSRFEESLKPMINTLLVKWSTQLATLSTPTWARLKLIAQTIKALDDISNMNMSWLSNDTLFENLRKSSNLLCSYSAFSTRVPSSLPCLNVLTENGELQPAVSLNSCIPFFHIVLKYLIKCSKVDTLITFLSNQHIVSYLEKLVEMEWSFESSWYTRHELLFLSNIVIAEQKICEQKKTISSSATIWKLSFDLVSALPGDKHEQVIYIIKYIFSHDKFREELLAGQMKTLDFKINANFDLPENTYEHYIKFVSRKGNWSEAAMPKDWLYLPIVNAYSKEQLPRTDKEINKIETSVAEINSIKALLILESTIPQLVIGLSASLRFSRICLVFLCREIYTDETISPILIKALSRFLNSFYKNIDLTANVPGLGSFTDLFTALCENYSAYSYGDKHFAMIILTFVTQRHDVHFRKSLWSEHADVLQSCRIATDELYFPLSEFLYPIETDASLIEYYVTSLVRKTIGPMYPVPYIIAIHHSAAYLKQDIPLAEKMRISLSKHYKDLTNFLMDYQPSC